MADIADNLAKLYDADILLWSEQQADLLRRAAAGERVNGLDWANIVEEIESVGREQLNAVRSLLRQALVHLLKLHGWPDDPSVYHWRSEVIAFLGDARERHARSMDHRLDLPSIYRLAYRQVAGDRIGGEPPRPLPATCPFTLADLLADDADPAGLAARLSGGG